MLNFSMLKIRKSAVLLVSSTIALMVVTPTIGAEPPPFEGRRAGEEREENGLKLKLCWCPPGNFTMGSPMNEEGRSNPTQVEPARRNNEDQVPVTITKGFWIGKFEVTQSEWQQVMRTTPAQQKAKPDSAGDLKQTGARFPMYLVNYAEAATFCSKLTDQERRAGRLQNNLKFTLPTEAQWEYACRAGTETPTAFGNNLSSEQANFDGNTPYGTAKKGAYLKGLAEVGSYKPNNWGLCDMHGSVYEWCADWYVENRTGGNDPFVIKATGATERLIRGGGWTDDGWACRSAYRSKLLPSVRINLVGFRVALVQSR